MAPIYTAPIRFHEGEKRMRSLLHVPDGDNPTSSGLSPYAKRLLHVSSLLAVGTLDDYDDEGRPWTTLLGGEPGFAMSLDQSIIRVKTLVDRKHDPVIRILLSDKQNGEVHGEETHGRSISALAIHLATRNRVKLSGKMIAGAFVNNGSNPEADQDGSDATEVQLVFAIQQSLGT